MYEPQLSDCYGIIGLGHHMATSGIYMVSIPVLLYSTVFVANTSLFVHPYPPQGLPEYTVAR